MSEELMPCPFCGAHSDAVRAFPRTCNKDTPYDARDRAYPIVRCLGCGASQDGKDWTGIETAIAKWNARPAPVQVPEGWKLVPVEPTPEMLESIANTVPCMTSDARLAYPAMLTAAPSTPDASRVAELEAALQERLRTNCATLKQRNDALGRIADLEAQLAASEQALERMREALESFDKAAKESSSIIGFAGKAMSLIAKTRAALAIANQGEGPST